MVLEVRRFFCDGGACCRKTFAEQITTVTRRYARRTNRLSTLIQAVGLLVGSSMGKRILKLLQISVSIWSMLRVLRKIPEPNFRTPRVLGVDDWAMRRGRRYGTVLVDLESGVVVDLLPDREAQTLAKWLRTHPGVEIISRDRAEGYAEGARQGAPEAVQVADRWHLLKNLGEMLVRVLSGHQPELRQLAQWLGTSPPAQGHSEADVGSPEPLSASYSQLASRRNQQFTEAHSLHDQGFSVTAIAR
jgi:transposase